MRNESELRSWLKHAMDSDRLFWIEHGAGGTLGLPDVLIASHSQLVPVELKVGKVSGEGIWQPELRAAQINTMRRMSEWGVWSYVLVGSIEDSSVWITNSRNIYKAQFEAMGKQSPVKMEPVADGIRILGLFRMH
jgi:hypothetical protein